MAQQSTLELIYSYSFAANAAFNFTINRDTSEKSAFKPSYICMVSVLPGIGSGKERSYDKNNKINFKFSLQELASLAFSLKGHATGGLKHPCSKFSQNNNESKWFNVAGATFKSGNTERPGVSMTVGAQGSSTKINTIIPQDQAYGLGMVLEKMFEHAMELEFNRSQNSTGFSRQSNNSYSSNNNISHDDSSSDSSDDSPFGNDFPQF